MQPSRVKHRVHERSTCLLLRCHSKSRSLVLTAQNLCLAVNNLRGKHTTAASWRSTPSTQFHSFLGRLSSASAIRLAQLQSPEQCVRSLKATIWGIEDSTQSRVAVHFQQIWNLASGYTEPSSSSASACIITLKTPSRGSSDSLHPLIMLSFSLMVRNLTKASQRNAAPCPRMSAPTSALVSGYLQAAASSRSRLFLF